MNDESEDTKKPQEMLGTDAAGVADASMAASSVAAEQDATVKAETQEPESAIGAEAQESAIDDSSYNPYDEIVAAVDDTKGDKSVVEEFSIGGDDGGADAVETDVGAVDSGKEPQGSKDDVTVVDQNDDRIMDTPYYIEENSLDDTEVAAIEAENKERIQKSINDGEEKDAQGFGTTKESEKDMSFTANKVSAADAAKRPSKKHGPATLNKRLLLTIVFSTLGTIFLAAVFIPTNWKKKKRDEERPIGGIALDNIEGYATKRTLPKKVAKATPKDTGDKNMRDIHSSADEKELPKHETQYDENGNVIIPTVTVEDSTPTGPTTPYSYGYAPVTTGSGGGGSSSTSTIPDTRNDRLQGKSIAGIKGLTSSQRSYSTDYDKTVEENTSAPNQMTGMFTLPSHDEFVSGQLNKSLAAYKSMYGENDPYATQNNQSNKQDFYNGGGNDRKLDPVTGVWLGLNTIWQGSIFEAVLTSEINTDLPGEVTARTAKDIYSSQDGRFLLIPQNSVLYGTYNSSISYAQSRVQVVWNTLIRPDGYQIDLGGMNGTDAKGASGLKGLINDHPMAYVKAILLMSAFSAINTEFTNDIADTNNQYVQNIFFANLGYKSRHTHPTGIGAHIVATHARKKYATSN